MHPIFVENDPRAAAANALEAAEARAGLAWREFDTHRNGLVDRKAREATDPKGFERLEELGDAYERAASEVAVARTAWKRAIGSARATSRDVDYRTEPLESTWGQKVAAAAVERKDLLASGFTLPPAFDSDIVVKPERARFVRQVIPTVTLEGTDRFKFIRQTVRTNAAVPVAAGSTKPTSTFTVESVEDRVRVLAHVSEAIDRSLLLDSSTLQEFVEAELRLGVLLAEDDQIVNGSGTGENIRGILNTTGIGSQALGTDTRADAVLKAMTSINVNELDADAALMNPNDWQDLAGEKDADGNYTFARPGAPVDIAGRRIWGLPIVVTNALTAGTVLVGAFAHGARLYIRDEARVDFSEHHSDIFVKNQVIGRGEERIGLAVTRPVAFVKITGF